jgi:hypothetical protein
MIAAIVVLRNSRVSGEISLKFSRGNVVIFKPPETFTIPRPINIGISVVSEHDVDLVVQSRDEYDQMGIFLIWRT